MKNAILFISAILAGLLGTFFFTSLQNQPPQYLVAPSNSPNSASQFSIKNAPSTSLKAQISTMSGKIDWQSRVATEQAALKAPTTIQQGERLVTEVDGRLKIEIPQVVIITLYPKSDLSLIQTLPADIVLNQTKGQVEYISSGTTPISVRSLGLLLNQNSSGDLLVTINENLPIISVKVLKGEITLAYNDLQNNSQLLNISSGTQFVFNNTTLQGTLR